MHEYGASSEVPRHVLIVEDEANQRSMLLRAVSEMDFQGTAVESAEAALELLDEQPPGVAILDLNLPGMGGLELAARIRERWPHVPFLILTGFGDIETAQQAIRLDAVDFLLKPCPLDELEAALERAWRKSLDAAEARRPQAPAPPSPGAKDPKTIDDAERDMIFAALARHDNNRTAAAEELGISVRTLYYRLARYETRKRH